MTFFNLAELVWFGLYTAAWALLAHCLAITVIEDLDRWRLKRAS